LANVPPGPDAETSRLLASLAAAAGAEVREFVPLSGGHGARHSRVSLADGRDLYVKQAAGADPDGSARLEAEASGLRWLAEAGAVPVPEVILCQKGAVALPWLREDNTEASAAERFGRDLAALHRAAADGFGAPWPGFIASLPLPNDRGDHWPSWYASARLLPYCRLARDAGTFAAADVALVETVADRIGELAGPAGAEAPSRIHGDCWSGNVLWSGGRGWLIDPAAHGGHRETDLAMLELFGVPFGGRILAAYRESAPLADGWRARVPLHQLHPLLVHVCLFGAGYRESALAAARAALSG
jgi:fructosamine-3-kinase